MLREETLNAFLPLLAFWPVPAGDPDSSVTEHKKFPLGREAGGPN